VEDAATGTEITAKGYWRDIVTLADQLIERLERVTQQDFDSVNSEIMFGFASGKLTANDVNRIDRVAKRRVREWGKDLRGIPRLRLKR
jgi:hypothetical protein